jgi:Na+-driven multidrug efflux pump
MKVLLLGLTLGGLLVASLVWASRLWLGVGEVEISGHGILALVLGVLLSLGLGMGLMFLVFYSSRHGHDDDAGR